MDLLAYLTFGGKREYIPRPPSLPEIRYIKAGSHSESQVCELVDAKLKSVRASLKSWRPKLPKEVIAAGKPPPPPLPIVAPTVKVSCSPVGSRCVVTKETLRFIIADLRPKERRYRPKKEITEKREQLGDGANRVGSCFRMANLTASVVERTKNKLRKLDADTCAKRWSGDILLSDGSRDSESGNESSSDSSACGSQNDSHDIRNGSQEEWKPDQSQVDNPICEEFYSVFRMGLSDYFAQKRATRAPIKLLPPPPPRGDVREVTKADIASVCPWTKFMRSEDMESSITDSWNDDFCSTSSPSSGNSSNGGPSSNRQTFIVPQDGHGPFPVKAGENIVFHTHVPMGRQQMHVPTDYESRHYIPAIYRPVNDDLLDLIQRCSVPIQGKTEGREGREEDGELDGRLDDDDVCELYHSEEVEERELVEFEGEMLEEIVVEPSTVSNFQATSVTEHEDGKVFSSWLHLGTPIENSIGECTGPIEATGEPIEYGVGFVERHLSTDSGSFNSNSDSDVYISTDSLSSDMSGTSDTSDSSAIMDDISMSMKHVSELYRDSLECLECHEHCGQSPDEIDTRLTSSDMFTDLGSWSGIKRYTDTRVSDTKTWYSDDDRLSINDCMGHLSDSDYLDVSGGPCGPCQPCQPVNSLLESDAITESVNLVSSVSLDNFNAQCCDLLPSICDDGTIITKCSESTTDLTASLSASLSASTSDSDLDSGPDSNASTSDSDSEGDTSWCTLCNPSSRCGNHCGNHCGTCDSVISHDIRHTYHHLDEYTDSNSDSDSDSDSDSSSDNDSSESDKPTCVGSEYVSSMRRRKIISR